MVTQLEFFEGMVGKPIWFIVLMLMLGQAAAFELMFRLGKLPMRGKEARRDVFEPILNGVLTILALLQAFAVTEAQNRFESRRLLVVEEANAISTAYLDADVLKEPSREKLKTALRTYVDRRLEFYRARYHDRVLPKIYRETQDLMSEAWNLAVSESKKEPNPTHAMLLSALAFITDVQESVESAYENHTPETSVWLLIGTSVMLMACIGFIDGLAGQRTFVSAGILGIMIAGILATSLDLDRPRRGTIVPKFEAMVRLQESMRAK